MSALIAQQFRVMTAELILCTANDYFLSTLNITKNKKGNQGYFPTALSFMLFAITLILRVHTGSVAFLHHNSSHEYTVPSHSRVAGEFKLFKNLDDLGV